MRFISTFGSVRRKQTDGRVDFHQNEKGVETSTLPFYCFGSYFELHFAFRGWCVSGTVACERQGTAAAVVLTS